MNHYHFEELIDLSRIFQIDLSNKSREAKYSWGRFAAYYFLKFYGNDVAYIAKLFGRDHATVSYGIKKFEEGVSINDQVAMSYLEKIKNDMMIKMFTVKKVLTKPEFKNGFWQIRVTANAGNIVQDFDLSYDTKEEAEKVSDNSWFPVQV